MKISKEPENAFILTAFHLFQVEQKILARGGRSVEDKRADSEFKQVTCVPVNVIGFSFYYLSPLRCKFQAGLLKH